MNSWKNSHPVDKTSVAEYHHKYGDATVTRVDHQCKICQSKFTLNDREATDHLRKHEGMTIQEYYQKFICNERKEPASQEGLFSKNLETGLVNPQVIFCWLFTIKDQCTKVSFQQTHNQGLRQLLLTVGTFVPRAA